MTREDWRRRMRITRRTIGGVFLYFLGPPLVRLLSKSWRVERIGEEHYDHASGQRGWLATLWHGRMLVALQPHEKRGLVVLVSPSDDGTLMKRALRHFGYGIIRGSSNKSPARAIREMLDGLRDGQAVIITPDGPRGPRHSVNPGPAWMARETGYPILPCGFVCDRAWHLKSWDRFTIPKFGARVALVYSEPLYVGRDATDDELLQTTEEMRARMMAAEETGFRRLEREPDW